MFENNDALDRYILDNYPLVTDHRIDQDHWDLQCTNCKVTRGFQVIKRETSGNTVSRYSSNHAADIRSFAQDFHAPVTYLFRCPVCSAFKQWIVYEIDLRDDKGKRQTHYFRVTSIPSEGLEDITELPETPPSLRTAYRQAIRAMDANAHLAAAAMFRRALQVITRELLGAKPGNLGVELNSVIGKTYNGTTITSNFSDIGYVIKEAGNQGAHPDQDPDLLDFTQQDTEDLQQIFMELVSELFIIPAATKKAKEDFLARRKIKS